MSIISEPKGRWRTGSTEVAALIDWVAASHTRTVALLIVLSLAAFLPGLFQIPPVDRDEARFAQATKQMIETGDYVEHPLPGGGALQEAGRHLLAPGRGR